MPMCDNVSMRTFKRLKRNDKPRCQFHNTHMSNSRAVTARLASRIYSETLALLQPC